MKPQEENQISQQVGQSLEKEVKSAETVIVEPKFYEIGLAELSAEIKRQGNLSLFNGIVIGILENQVWSIKSLDQRKVKKWTKIFSLMKESLATSIEYSASHNPSILKQIQPIGFPNLKGLNLFCAEIENYEAFTFLSAPCLQYLNIIYNNSPNFKAFNKMNLPSLKVLCIYLRRRNIQTENQGESYYNFSIQDFQRWGFNLQELRLQKAHYDAVTMQDFSKLAKSKSSLANIYYCRLNRINQQKIRNVFTQGKNINFNLFPQAQNNYALHQYLDQLDI